MFQGPLAGFWAPDRLQKSLNASEAYSFIRVSLTCFRAPWLAWRARDLFQGPLTGFRGPWDVSKAFYLYLGP